MRRKNLNQGITLIALVVTIIVLLILAGVSISMVSSDNGIATKAKLSAEKTNKSSQIEEIQLEITNITLENEGGISEEEFEDLLKTYGTLSSEEELLDRTLTTKKDGTKIKVIEIYDGPFSGDVGEKSITLSNASLTITAGGEKTLTATLTGISGNIVWTVTDESVAKIASSNIFTADIKGISKGNTVVTATCGKYKATCEIAVEESLEIAITNTTRKETEAEVTVNVNNISSTETVKYVCYIKEKDADDSKYEKKHEIETTAGEETVITFDELNYGFYYTVKIEATDGRGVTGTKIQEIQWYCFVEGTKVLTETGLRNIEDIKVGDKVYTLNLNNNQRELKTVEYTYEGFTSEIYEFTIGNEIIKATPKHQFYIQDKGWVRAYDIEVGDKLVAKDNENMQITKIEYKHLEEPIKIYNMTVEDNHNYLITESELLVHNVGSK